MNTVTLGGTATINDLVSVARFGAKVAFSKEYEERVNHCRAHVDRFSHEGKAIYGLTTGLGDNWKKFIPERTAKRSSATTSTPIPAPSASPSPRSARAQ